MDKIYFHPLFYIVSFIYLLTGHFKNLFYFTIIILIHELGHTLTGLILKFKVKKIEIYPYGGCSKLEYDLNELLSKELLVLIMGPFVQLGFMYLVKILELSVPDYFYTYNYLILAFNLLPIYPLDGGRLFQIIICFLFSYYNSLKYTIYLSYFVYLLIFFYFIFFNWSLVTLLIFILLGLQIYKEIKQVDYYFNKFLIERYIYDYCFKKKKIILDIKKMKKGYYHFFKRNNSNIGEKEILNEYFKNMKIKINDQN